MPHGIKRAINAVVDRTGTIGDDATADAAAEWKLSRFRDLENQ